MDDNVIPVLVTAIVAAGLGFFWGFVAGSERNAQVSGYEITRAQEVCTHNGGLLFVEKEPGLAFQPEAVVCVNGARFDWDTVEDIVK